MKQVIIKEDALRRVIRKTLLEYIGSEGEFGLRPEDDPFDSGYNNQPTNALVDDDGENHDMSIVGDGELDPTYYDDPDQYVDHHEDYISDWDLYRGL